MELFSYLDPLQKEGFAVDFVPRVAGVPVSLDKGEAVRALMPSHQAAVERLGYRWEDCWRAEQVHGADLEVISQAGPSRELPGVDGLLTHLPGVLLGIYVADCGLIWVADRETGAIALLHSGKKGSEKGILSRAVGRMEQEFGSRAKDLLVVLGPCIRPPHYEIDFAAQIGQQAQEAGVGDYLDCGLCTGADLQSYYSYRLEKGNTGRMLGLLGGRGEG